MTDGGFIAVPREGIGKIAWDAFATASDEAWVQHIFDFGPTFAAWPGFTDHSFAVVHRNAPDHLLALVPCHVSAGNWITTIYPACGNAAGERVTRKVRLFARSHLTRLARHSGLPAIYGYAQPMAPAFRGPRCPRVNPFLHMRFDNIQTQTYVLDLRAGSAALWDCFESYCRTHVRKAQKEGVYVRMADKPADLESYYAMHIETYRRTGVTPHPFAYFERIWENFVQPGYARIFLAERDGTVLAADNEAIWKGAMGGWTAAGRPEAAAIGANNLLHWHAMGWAIEHGCEWYECGEGFPEAEDGKKKGLTDFKRSFGGELYPFFKGQVVLVSATTGDEATGATSSSPGPLGLGLGRMAKRLFTGLR